MNVPIALLHRAVDGSYVADRSYRSSVLLAGCSLYHLPWLPSNYYSTSVNNYLQGHGYGSAYVIYAQHQAPGTIVKRSRVY